LDGDASACYGAGGTLPTVTDADLLLGILNDRGFTSKTIWVGSQGGLAAVARGDVPIQTIVRRIQHAAVEPAGHFRLFVPMQHRMPARKPIQAGGLFGPKGIRIGRGAIVNRRIVPIRATFESVDGRERTILGEERFDG